MINPKTGLAAFNSVIPIIMPWDENPYLIYVFLQNPEISTNGKEVFWEFFLYSYKKNQTAIYRFDSKTLTTRITKPNFYRSNINRWLSINQLKSFKLLDSDWAAQKASELGLPLNKNGFIAANLTGKLEINNLIWHFNYKTLEDKEWVLELDMLQGNVKNHIQKYEDLSPFFGLTKPSQVTIFNKLAPKTLDLLGLNIDALDVNPKLNKIAQEYTQVELAPHKTLAGHSSIVRSVKFNIDGRLIASGSADGTIRFWDIASGQQIKEFSFSQEIGAIEFLPDNNFLVVGFRDGTLGLLNVQCGEITKTYKGHKDLVLSIALSKDGQKIASGSCDSTARLWEQTTGRELLKIEHSNWVQSVTFNSNGSLLATGSDDQKAKIWSLLEDQELKTISLVGKSNEISSVIFSPDDKFLIIGTKNKKIRLWNLENDKELKKLNAHPLGGSLSLAFSKDGNYLASGGSDNIIKIWDFKKGKPIRSLAGHSGFVESVAFDSTGKYLASGSADKTVKIWEIEAG